MIGHNSHLTSHKPFNQITHFKYASKMKRLNTTLCCEEALSGSNKGQTLNT